MKIIRRITILLSLLFFSSCTKIETPPSGPFSNLPTTSEGTGPTAAYMQFRTFVKTEKYPEAFALLNEAARQEFRSVAITVLGMAGVPSSKSKDMSDLEIFTLVMSHQTPHEFKITAENIDDDNATLKALITQGDQTQPITIKMKKNRDKWLIQSTGVAFGQ